MDGRMERPGGRVQPRLRTQLAGRAMMRFSIGPSEIYLLSAEGGRVQHAWTTTTGWGGRGVGIGWRAWHDSLRAPVRRGYAAMMRFAMFAAPPLAAVCHCIFALAIFGVSAPPPPAAR